MSDTLLSVRGLETVFHSDAGTVRAVDGVSFDIHRGEVFAVVGESGSGKTVTALSILGLVPSPPGSIEAGEILWKGEDLLTLSPKRLREIRGNEIAMVFQDALTALNPVQSVGRQIADVVRTHEGLPKKAAWRRAVDALGAVGIPQPERRAHDYPHQFSGGMRQRAMIAMAIVCEPDLLIADEPTTALDVTVQAQVLEVLVAMQERVGSAILLITHDLGVVAGVADRVMVMYAGRRAEGGTVDELFYRNAHPYTLGLLASLPSLDDTSGEEVLVPIPGQPPSLVRVPPGCPFHPRCAFADGDRCETEVPAFRPVDQPDHLAACHYAEEVLDVDVDAYRLRSAVST